MTERPVFSECVIGYRSWRLADWVLAPVSYGDPWRPGVNRAVCKVNETAFGLYSTMLGRGAPAPPARHTAPHQNCTCGLHAYHDLPANTEGVVIGAVAAWGNLQVHCNGFRAEHAQILALVEADGLTEVAELYGVPLVPRSMLTMEAHQHGSPLPVSLRPEKPKPVENELAGLRNIYSQQLTAAWPQFYPTAPIQWTWAPSPPVITTVVDPALNSPSFWTPADEAQATPEQKLAKYAKKPSNRQGPPRPKRPPRHLGSGS